MYARAPAAGKRAGKGMIFLKNRALHGGRINVMIRSLM
jgi:hypothetical protein